MLGLLALAEGRPATGWGGRRLGRPLEEVLEGPTERLLVLLAGPLVLGTVVKINPAAAGFLILIVHCEITPFRWVISHSIPFSD